MEEYKKFWQNYFNFSGRSTRREFWIPVLINIVIAGILSAISTSLGSIFGLAYLIPSLANGIRRLHDINKSGWYYLIALIPLVGAIILIVFWATDSVNEGNAYGDLEASEVKENKDEKSE